MESKEHELVVFEDRVGVIIRATNVDMDRKIKESRQLLKSIIKNYIKSTAEVKDVSTTDISTTINIDEIARKIGIDETKLKELFDIGQNNIYLIGQVSGAGINEKVRNASLMVLTLYDHIFGRAMKTTELRDILMNAGLPLTNLGTILKEERNLIIRTGKPKSHDMDYRLTQPGKREGLKLIFEHIGIKTQEKQSDGNIKEETIQ